jgi:hypothetical protein
VKWTACDIDGVHGGRREVFSGQDTQSVGVRQTC